MRNPSSVDARIKLDSFFLVGYLESVLEDLGIKLNQDLYQFQTLMKHYDDFQQYCREQGAKIPNRIVDAVKRMKFPKT